MITFSEVDAIVHQYLVDPDEDVWSADDRAWAIYEAAVSVAAGRPDARSRVVSIPVNNDLFTFALQDDHETFIKVVALMSPDDTHVCKGLKQISEEDALDANPCWQCGALDANPSYYVYARDCPHLIWLFDGKVTAGTNLVCVVSKSIPSKAEIVQTDEIPLRKGFLPSVVSYAMMRLQTGVASAAQKEGLYGQQYAGAMQLKQVADDSVNPTAYMAKQGK